MKIADKLRMIRKVAPHGPSPLGQIYSAKADLSRTYNRISFWTIFKSEDGRHSVRVHVFISKQKARSPQQWYEWLGRNLDAIQRKHVLHGLNKRTGRSWFIYKKLGWLGHARKFSNTAAVGRKWRPPKS